MTRRVPNRSESAPHAKAPAAIERKLRSAAVAMPVRDQPIASDIGWRNTASDVIAPIPTQVITMPTPTMTQP
jgi:hypothetical protein